MIFLNKLKKINLRYKVIFGVFIVVGMMLLVAGLLLDKSADEMQKFIAIRNNADDIFLKQQISVHKPSMQANQVLLKLNQKLTSVLVEPLTNAQRLQTAKEGNTLLEQLELQIDQITLANDSASSVVDELEQTANELSNNNLRETAKEIIENERERLTIIEDIRGLSYKTDFHIRKIFSDVIKAHGELTDEYVTHLNTQVASMEKGFDRRSALYNELTQLTKRIDEAYIKFSEV